MPAYEYVCNDCKIEFTVFLSLSELVSNPRIKCPHCGSDNTHKMISGFYAKTAKKS